MMLVSLNFLPLEESLGQKTKLYTNLTVLDNRHQQVCVNKKEGLFSSMKMKLQNMG